jgi:hypothetical protein
MKIMHMSTLTKLSFMASIIALECSAALPTIGSKITLMKATGTLDDNLHIHSLLSTTTPNVMSCSRNNHMHEYGVAQK